jgi:hypothetical protein
MTDRFESPIDVEGETPATALPGVAQMVVAVGIATFVLVMLNARALANWTAARAPDSRAAAFDPAAQHLAAVTQARGLDDARAAIKTQWERAKAARWPDQR